MSSGDAPVQNVLHLLGKYDADYELYLHVGQINAQIPLHLIRKSGAQKGSLRQQYEIFFSPQFPQR